MDKRQTENREFLKATKQNFKETPGEPSSKEVELGARLILEEAFETVEAAGVLVLDGRGRAIRFNELNFHKSRPVDLAKLADGLGDTKFVVYGMANQHGIDLEPFDDVIFESNMSKVKNGTEDPLTGKFLKPSDWMSPDFQGIINKQVEGTKEPSNAVLPPPLPASPFDREGVPEDSAEDSAEVTDGQDNTQS